MASPREDIDLEVRLRNPKHAREWIDEFNSERKKTFKSPLKYLVLNRFSTEQRTIFFDRMTDREAVEVAFHILLNFEVLEAVEQAEFAGGAAAHH